MKALRLHPVGALRLHDEPAPIPGPGEVLLRVTAVGVFGSDLHWLSEAGIGDAQLKKPLILGHEFAGVIEGGQHLVESGLVDVRSLVTHHSSLADFDQAFSFAQRREGLKVIIKP
jgi:threonine dehydrogenase-like Zn-dependent dehydrogenase